MRRRKNETQETVKRATKKRKVNWKKIALALVSVCIIVTISGGAYFAWSVYQETEDFDVERLYSGEASKIFDKNGDLIYTFGSDENGKRTNVEYEDLPQVLVDAVVSAEDSRFFEHDGFDLPRIAKAAITNLMQFRIAGGGSTITQQVIKKSYFPEAEKTYTRKISEIFLAMQATKEVSKEEILTLYLNKIYFGKSINAIGIAAASKYYFNKDVQNLTLPEAALLAGTLNSPNRYDPYYNLEAATTRRNLILNLMFDHGYITEEERDAAKKVAVENMLSKGTTTTSNAFQAYIDIVADEVEEKTGLDPTEVQMNIYTYMDPTIQSYADELVNGGGYKFADEFMQVGASIQNNSGQIVGIIAGRNNVAFGTNRSQSKQQPGSSLKPILSYGAAFEFLNWSTAHQVEDKAYTKGDWKPTNYDGTIGAHGKMSIGNALENSWNLPAIWTLDAVCKEKTSEQLYEFLEGFGVDMSKESKTAIGPVYAIGGWDYGTSPIELASMYSTIANNGSHIEAHSINYVTIVNENKNIQVDKDCQDSANQAISAAAAFMIREVQSEYSYAGLSGNQIRAKTGTTNYPRDGQFKGAAKDSWLAAYNPDYSVAVWMGYDYQDAIDKGLTMEKHMLEARKFCAALFSKLVENGVTNSYPAQPNDVYQASIVKGVYPYKSPSANTPASKIATGWFRKGHGPSDTMSDIGINNLGSFDASILGDGRISVNFSAYDPIQATTNDQTNEATQLYGKVVYAIEVVDASTKQTLYSTKLSTNTGTLDYKPTGQVIVTGYYTYENAEGIKSNTISKTIGSVKELKDISFSATYGSTAIKNGGSITLPTGTTEASINVSVTPQSTSSVLEVSILNSTGALIQGPTKLNTASPTCTISKLTAGKYTIKITEKDGELSAPIGQLTFTVVASQTPEPTTPDTNNSQNQQPNTQ